MHKYKGGLNALGIFYQSTLGWCRDKTRQVVIALEFNKVVEMI